MPSDPTIRECRHCFRRHPEDEMCWPAEARDRTYGQPDGDGWSGTCDSLEGFVLDITNPRQRTHEGAHGFQVEEAKRVTAWLREGFADGRLTIGDLFPGAELEADTPPGPATRLDRVRAWLHDRLPAGVQCPACGQHAKVYRRNLNSGQAVALLTMHAAAGTDWAHKPTVLRGVAASARDESLLRFWGLLEEEKTERPDGGRAGWWRVTLAGAIWASGEATVPKYVDVYDGQPVGDPYGPQVSIDDVLGDKFNRRELLAARARAV